jgi:hypothetical protein
VCTTNKDGLPVLDRSSYAAVAALGAQRSGRGRATGNEQASARDLRHHDDSMDRFRRSSRHICFIAVATYYLVVEFFVARRGVTRGSRAVLGLAKT